MPSMSQIGDFMVLSRQRCFWMALKQRSAGDTAVSSVRSPHTRPHPEEPRQRRLEGWAAGFMVRDGAGAPPHHEEQARSIRQNISTADLALALWRRGENAAAQI